MRRLSVPFVVLGFTFSALFLVGCGGSPAGSSSTGDATTSPASTVESPAAVEVAEGPTGEETYRRYCLSCHAVGVAGAPKVGKAEDWAPRVARGVDALLASSIEGVPPGMPARGLCSSCSDDELRDAITYMIEQ